MKRTIIRLSALGLMATLLAACATTAPSPTPAPAAAPVAAVKPDVAVATNAQGPVDLFMVLPDTGRIHAFGDTKNYFDFVTHGEVALTRTQVGAGPGGKTLVFGITGDDVKLNKPSLGEEVLSGKLPGNPFYGEALRGGRYFLFGSLKDMTDFVAFGEIPYSYTDIGAGPKGETIVMVMNKDSFAQGRPVFRLERFKAIRASVK